MGRTGVAAWNNVATPPVFATIAPAPIKPVSTTARLFAPSEVLLVDSPYAQAQAANIQLPLGEIPAWLIHQQGPAVDKARSPVAALRLPADLPGRLRPVPGKPLRFVADLGARTVELRPLTDSDQRFAVYSEVV